MIRERVRRYLARRWWTYVPLIHRRHPRRHLLVCAESSVLIEGFPRSANTWAFATFEHANPGLHVGRHLHCLGHVDHALRLGVPVVILVRDPVDAVASYRVRDPSLPRSMLIRDWLRFYRGIERRQDKVIVATFDQVTADPASVIRRLNEHADTSFRFFDSSPENLDAVRRRVDELDRLDIETGPDGSRAGVGRPDVARQHLVSEERDALAREVPRHTLAEAAELFRSMSSLANGSSPP